MNYMEKSSLKIATIMDNFSYECFKYECNLYQLDSNNWLKLLKSSKPDLLLVESAWHNSINLLELDKKSDNTLKSILAWCKDLNIPTVFWNNEDPVHFERFIDAAKNFDYIFTTDSDCIPLYKKTVGHDNVFLLPFAAQPHLHNPINKDTGKLGKTAYAGTWYPWYPSLADDLEMLFNPAMKYGLHIYDRMSNSKMNFYKYPDKYSSCIKPSVPYEDIASVYKKYDVFLNANISKDSPTAFARRVFELLACGTSVVSSYSPAIENILPGLVKLCKTQEEASTCIGELLNDSDLRDRLSLLGQREVFNKHTYKHRLEIILDKIGLAYRNECSPSVSIIVCTNRINYMNNVFDNYDRQNYKNKEMIIILNNNTMHLEEWENEAKKHSNVKVYKLDESISLGSCLNFAIEKSSFDYISKFDDDDYYAPEYMNDIMNAFKYTDADVVGKHSAFVYFEESNTLALSSPGSESFYTSHLRGGTMTIKREVFNKIRFSDITIGEDVDFLWKCRVNNINIYSVDKFNYVYLRHASANDNTWKIQDEEMMTRYCDFIIRTDDFKPYITV